MNTAPDSNRRCLKEDFKKSTGEATKHLGKGCHEKVTSLFFHRTCPKFLQIAHFLPVHVKNVENDIFTTTKASFPQTEAAFRVAKASQRRLTRGRSLCKM